MNVYGAIDYSLAGGAIPEKGSRITLKVTNAEDLSRNVLKVCVSHDCIDIHSLKLLLLEFLSSRFRWVLVP